MTTVTSGSYIKAGSMGARLYVPGMVKRAKALVLHFHGGAFTRGSIDTGRAVASLLAEAGAAVVSTDYPRAPEHRFPCALEMAFDALADLHKRRREFSSHRSLLFVAGEEAGANLAAALALIARDRRSAPLAGQILLSPMLDPQLASCSARLAEAGPVGCKWADGWHEYLGSADKASHPYATPLASSRLAGLAPALILTANDDVMRDESVLYASALRRADVTVDLHTLPAPTGWPDSLTDGTAPEAHWREPVRRHLDQFLTSNLAKVRNVS
jgi:acetyl esterase